MTNDQPARRHLLPKALDAESKSPHPERATDVAKSDITSSAETAAAVKGQWKHPN